VADLMCFIGPIVSFLGVLLSVYALVRVRQERDQLERLRSRDK
jgi:hypothetical protein